MPVIPLSEIFADFSKCIGCRACVSVCDSGALAISRRKVIKDQGRCISCCECLEICPALVFTIER